MDHLKTDQERKDRWYSKITPRPVAVRPATDWNDLLRDSDSDEEEASAVYSIPFHWLLHEKRTPSGLKQVIEKNGFAIVSEVLSPHECHKAIDLACDFLDACSFAEKASAAREGPSSSSSTDPLRDDDKKDPYFPKTVEGGIMPFYGSGHSSYAWYVRSRPSIRQVFEMLYNDNTSSDTDTDTDTDDKTISNNNQLVASLDGVILWTRGNHPSGDAGWFHVDQNPQQKPGFCAVQGLVNLLPTTRQTGGNVLVAQSHLHFPHHYLWEHPKSRDDSTSDEDEECRRLFYHERLREVDGDDWLEIDPHDTTVLDPDKVIMCLLQPGDLLLWDSRTAHCSHPPQVGATADSALAPPPGEPVQKKDFLIRAATLVSMMPMKSIPDQVLRQRLELVKNNNDDALSYRTLTHWVNKCAPLGEERPEQVALEKQRVETILRWQKNERRRQHSSSRRSKVLLSYNDLNLEQQRLVAAGLDHVDNNNEIR